MIFKPPPLQIHDKKLNLKKKQSQAPTYYIIIIPTLISSSANCVNSSQPAITRPPCPPGVPPQPPYAPPPGPSPQPPVSLYILPKTTGRKKRRLNYNTIILIAVKKKCVVGLINIQLSNLT